MAEWICGADVSYEIPAGLSIVVVIMLSSTLSMQGIVKYQEGGIFNWIFLLIHLHL
ncbi:MAG: hypothetical protein Ct9H300mP9_3030 [Candidatus Neomarinimicrobiota bacterium]|nr:MAG: hypothetical protein Ct9H300mP9_3030 [Candidatus Neomarinimicrobiota bacterium]